jgi:hypothetical protein
MTLGVAPEALVLGYLLNQRLVDRIQGKRAALPRFKCG